VVGSVSEDLITFIFMVETCFSHEDRGNIFLKILVITYKTTSVTSQKTSVNIFTEMITSNSDFAPC
jgi:hypothetical protein